MDAVTIVFAAAVPAAFIAGIVFGRKYEQKAVAKVLSELLRASRQRDQG